MYYPLNFSSMTVATMKKTAPISAETLPSDWMQTLNNFLSAPMRHAVNTWKISLIDAITEQAKIYERIAIGKKQVAQGKVADGDTIIQNIRSAVEKEKIQAKCWAFNDWDIYLFW